MNNDELKLRMIELLKEWDSWYWADIISTDFPKSDFQEIMKIENKTRNLLKELK